MTRRSMPLLSWTRSHPVALGLLCGALLPARAQQAVADFSAGPPNGSYGFNSSTPRTFPDLLRGTEGEAPPGTDKVPTVIFMHGSGGCVGGFGARVQPGVFSTAPQFWVHGDADDYAVMAPCQDYAQRIGQAGTPVELVVVPGAGHEFDGEPQRRVMVRGAPTTKADCPLEIDILTLVSCDRFTGQRLGSDALREVQKNSCSALGASVEGNHAARDKAADAITGFLRKTFGRRMMRA